MYVCVHGVTLSYKWFVWYIPGINIIQNITLIESHWLSAHTEAAQWLKIQPSVYSSQISAFHLPQGKAITSNTLPSLQMIIWLPAFLSMPLQLLSSHSSDPLPPHTGLLWVQHPPTASPSPPLTRIWRLPWKNLLCLFMFSRRKVLFKNFFNISGVKSLFEGALMMTSERWIHLLRAGSQVQQSTLT